MVEIIQLFMNAKFNFILSILLVLTIPSIFTGCANDQKDQQRMDKEAELNALKLAEDVELRATIARQTAALNAERDSIATAQQGIAIGELKFGMSEKETNSVLKIMRKGSSTYPVGNYEYLISPSFNSEGQLYRVRLKTPWEDASQIDIKVVPAMEDLISIIETKYGPAENRKRKLDFFDLDPNTMQIMGSWNVGTKGILVGAVEESSGSKYSAQAWIWDKPMQMVVDNAQLKKEAGAQLEAAEKF